MNIARKFLLLSVISSTSFLSPLKSMEAEDLLAEDTIFEYLYEKWIIPFGICDETCLAATQVQQEQCIDELSQDAKLMEADDNLEHNKSFVNEDPAQSYNNPESHEYCPWKPLIQAIQDVCNLKQHFKFFTQEKIAHALKTFLAAHGRTIESLENTQAEWFPRTIMHDACLLGYVDVVMIIIKACSNPLDLFSRTTDIDVTPLALALKRKCENFIKIENIEDLDDKHFVTIKAVINWAESTGNARGLLFISPELSGTLLHTAAFNGGSDVVAVIIACAEKGGFLAELLNAPHIAIDLRETAYEAVKRTLDNYESHLQNASGWNNHVREYYALRGVKAVLKRAQEDVDRERVPELPFPECVIS